RAPDGFQIPAQGAVVVDLTVEDDDESTARRRHRLMTMRRQIDDGEATNTQRDSRRRVDPNAAVVGTPMNDGFGHARRDSLQLLRAPVIPRKNSSQPAHVIPCLPVRIFDPTGSAHLKLDNALKQALFVLSGATSNLEG